MGYTKQLQSMYNAERQTLNAIRGVGLMYCQDYFTSKYPDMVAHIGQRIIHPLLPANLTRHVWTVAAIDIDNREGIAYCIEARCIRTGKTLRPSQAIELERGGYLKLPNK